MYTAFADADTAEGDFLRAILAIEQEAAAIERHRVYKWACPNCGEWITSLIIDPKPLATPPTDDLVEGDNEWVATLP